MHEAVMQKLKSANHLPSLPTVAIEVLRLAKSDDVKVDDIAKVVQNDPALSARILKVVNSPLFGMSREIGSIKQAMVILGIRTVKVMAVSFCRVDALKVNDAGEFDLEKYWRHSITTAVAARLIAKHLAPRQAEEAFVAGLLSDIGQFILWRCMPEQFAATRAAAEAGQLSICDAEMQSIGTTHAAIGADLLAQWTLPDSICKSIALHHAQAVGDLADSVRGMAWSVNTAAQIADLFTREVPTTSIGEVKQRILGQTNLGADALETVLENISQHVRSTANLLSLKIGEATSYSQLQVDASVELAKITMEAEMERAAATARAKEASEEISRLAEEKKAILEVAATDGLTKIANRAAFDKRLKEEIDRAAAARQPLGLILLDVDHFKKFNDTYGHRAGDEVLKGVARTLSQTASKAGMVARYGGEEFAVIAINAAATQLKALAEEIRRGIEATQIQHEGKALRVTASLGASSFLPGGPPTAPTQLVEQADQRLYAAKRAGRNRVEVSN